MKEDLKQTKDRFTYGEWMQKDMKKICQKMKEWHVSQLVLWKNDHSSIIKELQPVSFPLLIFLNLCGNEIESIQCLNRVQMPKIQKLALNYNNISNPRILRKTSWKELNNLQIFNNRMNEGRGMEGMLMQKITEMIIQTYDSDLQWNCSMCILKWKISLPNFYHCSPQYIIRPSEDRAFFRKFQQTVKIS